MKKRLVQLALMLAMLFMLLAGSNGGRVTVLASDDDPMPCDPPPPHLCEGRGGTFNYVTCRCEFP